MSKIVRGMSFPYRAATTPGGIEPAADAPGTGSDYDTAWARRYPARLTRAVIVEYLMRPTMALFAAPDRRGTDRLAHLDGPLIFAANHHSHADTPLLLTSVPEPWRHQLVVGAAADYFFSTRVTGAMSALAIGAIPIERSKVGRRSADLARSLVDDGWSLLIYPEGGRSKDGWGQPFRGGAAFLAKRCGVPVVPIHVEGTRKILPKGGGLPRRSPTTVTFGRPIVAGADEDTRDLAARIEAEVAALADEVATDWWQARQRAHGATSPELSGPRVGAWRRAWSLSAKDQKSLRRRWPAI